MPDVRPSISYGAARELAQEDTSDTAHYDGSPRDKPIAVDNRSYHQKPKSRLDGPETTFSDMAG